MDLEKREAGKPLSAAERQQRKDAAAARWREGGIALAGGAAAGLAANGAVSAVRARALRQVRAAHEPVRAENARHGRTMGSILRREQAAMAAIRKWPVPPYRQMLAHDANTDARKLRNMPTASFGTDPETGSDLVGPADQEQAARLSSEIERRRAQLADLATATPPKRVKFKGTMARVPKAHTRIIKVKNDERIASYKARLDELNRADDETVAALRVSGAAPHEIEDAEIHAENMRASRKRRVGRIRPDKKAVQVGHDRTEGDHQVKRPRKGGTRRVEGDPGDKRLKAMRQEMADRVHQTINPIKYREYLRHAEASGTASEAFRTEAAKLRWRLPTRSFRHGAIGAAALAGAAAAYFGSKQLSKAADVAPPDTAEQLAAHGVAAQESMQERLARIFRKWKDELAPTLLNDEPQSLRTTFAADLAHATEPMRDALQAGAKAEVPRTEGDGENQKIVSFKLGSIRNPLVEDYIRDYRDNKIAELTLEQIEAVQNTIIDAARRGASPQDMAARVKQTIGLTTNQAQQVLNYRQELMRGDPAALNRKLRDKRYDRTVEKAIEAGKTLSDAQIDAMVDAYHRRYLAYRAMTIARTEGVSAANNGHMAAIQNILDQNPDLVVVKVWMAKLDEHTRPDHRGLNGTPILGFETPFTAPSGDLIRWPGDQTAPARNVVNCRCTLATHLMSKRAAVRFMAENTTGKAG